MQSLPHRSRRHIIAMIGVVLASTAALSTPASAVIAVNATFVATSGCEADGQFHLHTTMGNTGGFGAAHFVVTGVDVYGPITIDLGVDVAANSTRDDDWKFFEGVPGSIHITSADADPLIDFLFEVTPDCVPDETVPSETVPDETLPPASVVSSGGGGGLPTTGAASWSITGLAAVFVLVGIALTRRTRRA